MTEQLTREKKIAEIRDWAEGKINLKEMSLGAGEAISFLLSELAEEKRHAALGWEQSNKWLEENGRLRAELDRVKSHGPEGRNYTNAEYVSLLQERESLRTELAEKDKVLEWIRDAGTDYQSIQKAREVLAQYKKGESQSEDA